MYDYDDALWTKAAASAANGGCVEVGRGGSLAGSVGIRDTKNREGGALVVSRSAFSALLADIKAGGLDL